jgi:alpha-tubulin suppressor-like RCC1 family protein
MSPSIILLVITLLMSSAASAQNVITWGSNLNNQLGRPNPSTNLTPGSISGLGSGSGTIAVAAGSAHTLALKSDGTVLAWGSNANGQLGDGTTVSRLSPAQVSGFGPGSGIVAIAAGSAFSLAVKSDGTVWSWGSNSNGQLGDGTTNSRLTPVQVTGVPAASGVTDIAAGSSYAIALKSDGTVLAWGANSNGQLGDGTTTQKLAPVQVSGLGAGSGVIGISAGSTHTLALKLDGTVLAWGSNSSGQLGDGTTTQATTPVQVSSFGPGSGVIVIAAGTSYSLALKSSGAVWSWGSNSSGQLGNGDGTFSSKTTPVQVSDPSGSGFLTGGLSIAAGSTFGLAVKADGTALAWGANSSGQLGDGTTTLRILPVSVTGLGSGSGTAKIYGGGTHSVALKSDGTALAWGANTNGQLGQGVFDGTPPLPVDVLTGITAVSTGANGSHTLARKSDGTIRSWGLNNTGQLGDGTTTVRTAPVQVTGALVSSGIVAVAAGGAHSLALKSDGAVVAWGSNTNGQVGDGTTTMKTAPVQVSTLGSGSTVSAIAAGNAHSLALKSDGTIWGWGSNGNGQLGNGSTATQVTSPVQVSSTSLGTTVVAIAAGSSHSLALRSDGAVFAWGLNTNGQLGDGTSTQRTSPVQVRDAVGTAFLTGIVAIAAGNSHSLALKSDGTVFAWGLNTSGQIGDGSTTQRNLPTAVDTLGTGSGVVRIAGGAFHSLAMKSNGAVLAWGNNSSGQLADGTLENRASPVTTLVTGALAIAAGNSHGVALAGSVDTTPAAITPSVAGTLGNNGWYRSDVTVTWTVSDPESNISSSTGCGPAAITNETNGITLTCTAVNGAGLSASSSVTIKIDKTPPAVSFTRTPANGNGWNNSAVLVHFSATDALSGMPGSGQIDKTVATQGQNQSTSAAYSDNAGNSVTAMVDGINIDMTPPTVQFGLPSPSPNGSGWNNTNVSIAFSTSDNLSGVVSTSIPSPLMLSAEGSNVTGSVVVTDAAGNTATVTAPAVKIDKTPPAATATASPAPDANGWNSTDVTVSFTGTDSLSGIAGCSAPVTLSSDGANQSASGTCTDNAGNGSAPATAGGINIRKGSMSFTGMPASDCTLWPIDLKLVQIADIRVAGGATFDPNSFSVQVTSNEPLKPTDVVITGGVVRVRADRLGNGTGRVYTVTARAKDAAGQEAVATGTCTAPHDKGQ